MKACRILRIQSASTYLPLRQPTPILTPQLSRISSHLSTIHKPRYFSAGRLSHFSRRPTALRKQDHQNPFRATRRNFATKTRADPSTKTASQQLTISQRFRKLSREYGWSAMGVYLGLSALDFPFCFAAVQWLGVERIGHAEQIIVGSIKQIIPDPVKDTWRRVKARKNGLTGQNEQESHVIEIKAEDALAQVIDEYDHGVRMAEEENKSENASIWTQLALAYAIHKSFIFLRVPLTVAVTPKVVKTLRRWGWDIGKRKPKVAKNPEA